MEELAPWHVETLIGMSPKVVALGLQQIGRQRRSAISIEVCQGRRERRNRQSQFDSGGDNTTPGRLSLFHCILEKVIQQQVFKVGILVEGVLNVLEKY